MKALLLAASLVLAPCATAQITFTTIGDITFGSDGSTATTIGDTTFVTGGSPVTRKPRAPLKRLATLPTSRTAKVSLQLSRRLGILRLAPTARPCRKSAILIL